MLRDHCIPVYPRFYLHNDKGATIPLAAREANEAMPHYAVGLLDGAVGSLEGERILLLGVAYRGGVKETAFSGAFALRDELIGRGATPVAHDPLYTADELSAMGFVPHDVSVRASGAILHTDHAEYRDLGADLLAGCSVVVDGRNWIRSVPDGVRRITIGRGDMPGSVGQASGSQGSAT